MRIRISFSRILVFLFVLGFGSEVTSQRRRPAPPPRAIESVYLPPKTDGLSPDQKLRLEAFDKVWRSIYYYYFDAKFSNISWESLKIEFEPKVRAAKSDEAFHDLMDQMVGRLKVSHLGIIRPAVFEAIEFAKETAREKAQEREERRIARREDETEKDDDDLDLDDPLSVYGPDIDLRLIGNKFVVFRVGANSAAEYRGIKPGYIIQTVDDVSLSELLFRVTLYEKGRTIVRRHLPQEVVKYLLNGDKDSTVKIEYLDEKDESKEQIIRRELVRGTTVSMGESLPESQFVYRDQELDDETGYIYFNSFALPTIERFCESIGRFKEKKNLVIDLRGNTGGIIGISMALTGMLSDRPFELGTAIYRHSSERLITKPKAKQFKGKIAVLTDELSISSAEMFASAIQATGRGRVFGVRTAGETLPSVSVDLQTGARLLYPIANFRTANGKFLEGSGVTPDKVVALDRVSLLKGIDPQLAAALEDLKTPRSLDRVDGPGSSEDKGRDSGKAEFSGKKPPPPPPPPAAKPLRNLGSVTVVAPPAPPEPPEKIEPKAIELMKEFERLSGGYERYQAIKTYELAGSIDTVSMAARDRREFRSYRDGDERLLTITRSDAVGELSTLRTGRSITFRSDFGVDEVIETKASMSQADFLFSIISSMRIDNYVRLLYLGEFPRGDRKVHLIDGKTKEGVTVAIYFDVETKMLAGFEGPTGGLSFGDYRRIGELMFPFNISSQEYLNIQLEDVKLNTTIDPKVFEPKLNCFDKP